MKNIIFKWKVVMDGDAYLRGGAHDIYLNSYYQTVTDLQLYGMKNDMYSNEYELNFHCLVPNVFV